MSARARRGARRTVGTGVVAAALTLLVAGGTASATTDEVRCGDLVTGEVTLTTHLSCEGVGLRLAPGAVLDLGGHQVSASDAQNGSAGVVGPESGSATVTHGTVLSDGVAILGHGGAVHVSHVEARGGVYGSGIAATNATIEHSTASGGASGVTCSGCVVRSSSVAGGSSSVVGATVIDSVVVTSIQGSTDVTLVDSVVRGEDTGVSGSATVIRTRFERVGIGIEARRHVVVVASTFVGGDAGLLVWGRGSALVVGSLFVGNRFGVQSWGGAVRLRNTTAVGNDEADVDAPEASREGWNVGVGTRAAPPRPLPGPPSELCGTVVATSTTLTTDLTCDRGLTLADGVTLDLAGRTVQGPGDGTGLVLQGAATVRGGTVRGWDVGIWSPATSPPDGERRVEGTTLTDNGVGVLAQAGTLVTRDVTWRSNTTGLRCDGTCTVRGGVLTDHLAAALDVTGTADLGGSTLRSGHAGILLTSARGTSAVTDSTFFDNARGIDVERSGLDATRDVLRRHDVAVAVTDGPEYAGAPAPPAVALTGLLVDRNRDGVVATATAADVRLRGNVVTRSTGYGIHAPGAVDLGGNVTVGNGRP